MAYRHTSGNVNGSANVSGGGLNRQQQQQQQQQQNHSMHEYSGDERESQRSGGGGGGATDRSSIINLQNKPTYLLEHLATFTVNKESGILYPADGMRRLLQLEKTTGIWSQKMQLCLDYPWVLIMDYETENIIEKFPATLIQEPTAFTSTDAMELYNNILVFIVSSGGSAGSRSEMHIFQSQNVSAVNLVEDLKQLRNGKNIIKQHNIQQQIQMPQQQQLQQQGSHNMLVQQKSERHSMGMVGMVSGMTSGGGVGAGDTDSERGEIIVGLNGLNDETSSTSSDKYERDVTVLNHCFDDIEKFIARLQHAAAALRELERRRRNRKSKKKDIGEGLLTLRTRPPHEKEFMDIFAKFKLSFNLLAKLKSHIHDPNAPELVHFLFTPLALIVEASNDTYYEAQLPSHVINPLLTREAINLLINCVTSKETELWRSLGDAWTVPRDQWKDDNNIGITYHPVFMDGWSPDYLVIDELEQQHHQQHSSSSPPTPTQMSPLSNASFKKRIAAAAHAATSNDNHYHRQPQQQQQQQHYHNQEQEHLNGHDFNTLEHFAIYGDNNNQHHQHSQATPIQTGHGNGAYDFSTRSKMSMDSIEHEPHDIIATTTNNNNPTTISRNNNNNNNNNDKIGGAINAITSGMQNMQTLYEGNIKNNNKTNNNNNDNINEQYSGIDDQQHLHHHHNHHHQQQQQQQHSNNNSNNNIITAWLDELQANNAKIVLVTYPRTANNDKELSVVRGEYLEVLDDTRKWWKARNIRGQVAHVPHTIVTPYNYDDRTDVVAPPTHFKSNYNNNNNKFNHANNEQMKDSLNNSQIGGIGGDNNSQWNRNKHLGKKGEFRYF